MRMVNLVDMMHELVQTKVLFKDSRQPVVIALSDSWLSGRLGTKVTTDMRSSKPREETHNP